MPRLKLTPVWGSGVDDVLADGVDAAGQEFAGVPVEFALHGFSASVGAESGVAVVRGVAEVAKAWWLHFFLISDWRLPTIQISFALIAFGVLNSWA